MEHSLVNPMLGLSTGADAPNTEHFGHSTEYPMVLGPLPTIGLSDNAYLSELPPRTNQCLLTITGALIEVRMLIVGERVTVLPAWVDVNQVAFTQYAPGSGHVSGGGGSVVGAGTGAAGAAPSHLGSSGTAGASGGPGAVTAGSASGIGVPLGAGGGGVAAGGTISTSAAGTTGMGGVGGGASGAGGVVGDNDAGNPSEWGEPTQGTDNAQTSGMVNAGGAASA
ncbi:unnamed protein product [Protopolystoma xenopodis]|uniref:Uncharacterized protein n=1 Tax=Protopolystoma xenopodis TaxID=117903 RepID=A0A448XBM5_9PLAT|nr:unnamed protein product [Protopolystoma xenopodis]